MDDFIGVLLRDIGEQFEFFGVTRVPSIYIGGGTPSALGASRMEHLLSGLGDLLSGRLPRDGGFEFTVEANPESADEDFLRVCRVGGVNRISLGVQSFHEVSRSALRRCGTGRLLESRLALAARYFPGALSLDLITGLPFQTESMLLCDIERALEYAPSHVSLYSLTVEEGTPLEWKLVAGKVSLPKRDDADLLWLTGRDALEKAGLFQYEVSSFARSGRQCVHNLRYWHMENWLGAGPAASGTVIDEQNGTGLRRSYPHNLDAYIATGKPALNLAEIEKLERSTLMRESLLMGFRCCEGPDAEVFRRRFSVDIVDYIPQTLERWRGRGFFEKNLAPSSGGLLFLDPFLRDAFAEMDNDQY